MQRSLHRFKRNQMNKNNLVWFVINVIACRYRSFYERYLSEHWCGSTFQRFKEIQCVRPFDTSLKPKINLLLLNCCCVLSWIEIPIFQTKMERKHFLIHTIAAHICIMAIEIMKIRVVQTFLRKKKKQREMDIQNISILINYHHKCVQWKSTKKKNRQCAWRPMCANFLQRSALRLWTWCCVQHLQRKKI